MADSIILIGSGIGWLAAHYGSDTTAATNDDLRRLADEALMLKVHGAAAFAAVGRFPAIASAARSSSRLLVR
ncbi:MAG: hypothetical protein E6H48_02110 [Betaproteobacteria bacterium]|nr:MAG: hypothetical protein E6H48_02110 [Betaproteobacteria bacterium]